MDQDRCIFEGPWTDQQKGDVRAALQPLAPVAQYRLIKVYGGYGRKTDQPYYYGRREDGPGRIDGSSNLGTFLGSVKKKINLDKKRKLKEENGSSGMV